MIILGIETSCDETAVAVLEQKNNRIQILSNVVASSASLQAKYGGIIPEQAAREQLKSIIPVIEESLEVAHIKPEDLDAIAVTQGPGLIGSLLVGVETAKTLATIWNEQSSRASRTKPLIPVNHLIGHFYANWINTLDTPQFPCLGLLVSGGHTDLVLFTNHGKYKYLGGTRDDAAGECFDKCARLLGLPYPGGPQISKLAKMGDSSKFKLPVPMNDKSLDFSYSGLKTAVANIIHTSKVDFDSLEVKQDLAASIEETIIKSLINKVVLAIQRYKVDQIMVAGGVAANQKLSSTLKQKCEELDIKLHIPTPSLCTDNGAMIASAAFFLPADRQGQKPIKNPLTLQADPNLALIT